MRRNLIRKERLRESRDIKDLFAIAERVEARGLKLLYKDNGSPVNRIAIVVGRGCGGAVRRNREKRLTREAYRSLKGATPPGYDVLFLVARFGAPLSERLASMAHLLGRAGLRGGTV